MTNGPVLVTHELLDTLSQAVEHHKARAEAAEGSLRALQQEIENLEHQCREKSGNAQAIQSTLALNWVADALSSLRPRK